ncbi:TPA: acetyltransferase [Clostridium perfringens]|nr:acetyltransferase [Clostridium perfringens]HBI6917933.1 acetyltransferase [Clostridium perfringens]HBI7037773.1 acetyltransferase [Clostridium perfringens]
MKDLIIIGAGGVGQELIYIINQINKKEKIWNVLGYVDDNKKIQDMTILGYKVLGGLNWLIDYATEKQDINVIVAIANYKIKKNIVKKINDKVNFATLIHPDVYIHESNNIGEGTIIYPGVIITVDVKVGNQVIISPKCGIGHNSVIGDYVSLLWNVNISGHDYIEEGALIGSGTTIIQNKKVGEGSIVGAGAVVVKDIAKYTTSIGVPARNINL